MSWKSLGQGVCPGSCSLGTGLPHQDSQRKAPLAAKLGRPEGDVREKREELSMCFYVALCICPDCFALNSVAGNLTGMWGVSSGISPQWNREEGGRKILSMTSLQLWKTALAHGPREGSSGTLWRNLHKLQAAPVAPGAGGGKDGLFSSIDQEVFCFWKIVFGKKKWGEAGRVALV